MPDLSLSQFRANVSDFARPNRFWVSIGDPSNDILTSGDDNSVVMTSWQQNHEFLVKTTSLPGRTMGNVQLKWQGMDYNLAGDPTFEDITFTFHNNYEFDLRSFFEGWMESMAEMSSNERSQPGKYKSDVVTMQQLGRTQNDILATYTLIGAYPTTVSAIELSMENSDQVEEVTVTMKFDYFEVVKA